MSTYIVQIDKDEEVLEKLNSAIEALGVERGPTTLIGAVQECTVSVMAKNDAQVDPGCSQGRDMSVLDKSEYLW